VNQVVSSDVDLAAGQPDQRSLPGKKATTSVLFVVFLLIGFKSLCRKLAKSEQRASGGWRSECNSFEFNYLRQRLPAST